MALQEGENGVCNPQQRGMAGGYQRPLDDPMLVQYVDVRQRTQSTILDSMLQDHLEWRWTVFGLYNVLFVGQHSTAGAKELWKVKAPDKCRFFMWLAILGRCWTWKQLATAWATQQWLL
jgi:hypothetical protein